jgi:hypothetical protein
MGSWHEKCLISGFPINESEKVIMVVPTSFKVIEHIQGISEYINFILSSKIIEGIYDGYGRVEGTKFKNEEHLQTIFIKIYIWNDVIKFVKANSTKKQLDSIFQLVEDFHKNILEWHKLSKDSKPYPLSDDFDYKPINKLQRELMIIYYFAFNAYIDIQSPINYKGHQFYNCNKKTDIKNDIKLQMDILKRRYLGCRHNH